MARVNKPKQHPKKRELPITKRPGNPRPKGPRKIVSQWGLLDESELCDYGSQKYLSSELERGKMAKPNFTPVITTLVNSPDPLASDCPMDKISEEFWAKVMEKNGATRPPLNYTGRVPAVSEGDRRNWLIALREEKAGSNESGIILGEL